MNSGTQTDSFFRVTVIIFGVFIVCVATTLSVFFFRDAPRARAQVALFYPTTCLGGWSNANNAAGAPQVLEGSGVAYTDSNSASIVDKTTELYCGGFKGEMPYGATQERVSLRFSWHMEDVVDTAVVPVEESSVGGSEMSPSSGGQDVEPAPFPDESAVSQEGEGEDASVLEQNTEPSSESPAAETSSGDASTERRDVSEPDMNAQEVPQEESSVDLPQESVSYLQRFFFVSQVSAAENTSVTQEESSELHVDPQDTEAPVENVSTTTSHDVSIDEVGQEVPREDGRETMTQGGYFEVLYTFDGVSWTSLGVVEEIDNAISFEMPPHVFVPGVDLSKVQIALRSLASYDTVPKIFLDSLWFEVAYALPGDDPLTPPGQKDGDVIFSEAVHENLSAVVVLRNVSDLSYLALTSTTSLIESAGSTTAQEDTYASSTSGSGPATDESLVTLSALLGATSSVDGAATSTPGAVTTTSTTSREILLALAQARGVELELWVRDAGTRSWSFVASDELLSRDPQVRFISNNIFWIGHDGRSLWRFNVESGGYDSLSLTSGESSEMYFLDGTNERQKVYLSEAGLLQIESVASDDALKNER